MAVGRLLRRLAVRTTVFGGVTYYTIQEGVWSSTDDAIKVYENLYALTAPLFNEGILKEAKNEIKQLPSMSCVTSFIKSSWNTGVMSSIKFVSEIPDHACSSVNKLSEMVKKQINDATKA